MITDHIKDLYGNLQKFRGFLNKFMKKVIYVDIDETICTSPKDRNYLKAKPIQEHIDKINQLYDEGNTIVYWTSRGSRKQIDWYDQTETQLKSWGVKYNELRVYKPYYDLFIDDKTKNIELVYKVYG
jgi:hydroxymethylpyrimidine pyrophosphatase-like HAD family hydrolase